MKLKTKLIALNSVILFIVGTMMFLQFRSAQTKQKYEIRKGFAQSSIKLQRGISNVFYFYYHNVQSFALNKSLQTKNFDDVNFYFNELVNLYPLYDMVLFVDKDGQFIASNNLDRNGKKLPVDKIRNLDFSNESWFKELKKGNLVEESDKNINGSYVSKFDKSKVVSDLHESDKVGNFYATPVNDEFGNVVGYLATFVNSSWLSNELLSTDQTMKKAGKIGADIIVANKDGLTIAEIKNGKVVEDSFLNLNILKTYSSQIASSKSLKKPSFFEAMLYTDDSPLNSYADFENPKFVSSIGWKSFIKMNSENSFSAIHTASNIFSISFFIILGIGSFIGFIVSSKLSNNLLDIAKDIADGSLNILNAAETLSGQSGKLSNATSDQASSLQETVASLNEISAMVNKNTDASQGSKGLSAKSRASAEEGKRAINNMIGSIDDISDANNEIIGQMTQNAKEIQEIIVVIREIEDKTKVINDIVFQTKLLSFNASVEAARAGEHGKGFSVVAEEVGNLAQHSGDAAKQIEEMLIQSVNRVEAIANNTESKVKDLIHKGTTKVEAGKKVARQCDGALGEILENANNLDNMIEEIAIASVEQSQGVQEISKAMSELDQVTKKNSMIAQETSLSTQALNKQSSGLKDISILLTDLITGNKGSKIDLNSLKSQESEQENVADFSGKQVTKQESVEQQDNVVEFKPKASNKKSEPIIEKKVASSDLAVPSSADGEWEDI